MHETDHISNFLLLQPLYCEEYTTVLCKPCNIHTTPLYFLHHRTVYMCMRTVHDVHCTLNNVHHYAQYSVLYCTVHTTVQRKPFYLEICRGGDERSWIIIIVIIIIRCIEDIIKYILLHLSDLRVTVKPTLKENYIKTLVLGGAIRWLVEAGIFDSEDQHLLNYVYPTRLDHTSL